jgi:hypothetical protein
MDITFFRSIGGKNKKGKNYKLNFLRRWNSKFVIHNRNSTVFLPSKNNGYSRDTKKGIRIKI